MSVQGIHYVYFICLIYLLYFVYFTYFVYFVSVLVVRQGVTRHLVELSDKQTEQHLRYVPFLYTDCTSVLLFTYIHYIVPASGANFV